MEETKIENIFTITTLFCVPTLQIGEILRENNFLNAYVRDEMHETVYEESVYLLFKPDNIDKFREFLDEEYEKEKGIIEDYDHGKFVVVVYKLNSEFKEDFDLIRKGKYSKTSEKFQEQFPKVKKIMIRGLHRDELSLQFRIFKKTEDLVDYWEKKFDVTFDDEQEVWRGYSQENEILTEEILKEYEEL